MKSLRIELGTSSKDGSALTNCGTRLLRVAFSSIKQFDSMTSIKFDLTRICAVCSLQGWRSSIQFCLCIGQNISISKSSSPKIITEVTYTVFALTSVFNCVSNLQGEISCVFDDGSSTLNDES